MQITEVRIKLMEDPHERLMAFCSITLEGCFVVRDLKLIQGKNGPFVAMPSRKLTDRCPRCHMKNHLRAGYCNQCGARLNDDRALKDDAGRAKLYADIAHPINSSCRELIQTEVVKAFERELILASEPGYVCAYDDYGEDRFADLDELEYTSEFTGPSNIHYRIDPPEPIHRPADAEGNHKNSREYSHQRFDDDFGDGLI